MHASQVGGRSMDVLIEILAWFHIFFAIGWIGGALLMEFAVNPTLKNLTPQSSIEFTGKFVPRVGIFMGVFSTLTVAFGPLLFLTITGWKIPLPDDGWNIIMYIGIAGAIAVYAFGILVLMPLSTKISDAYKKSSFPTLNSLIEKMRYLMLVDLAALLFVFTVMLTATFL